MIQKLISIILASMLAATAVPDNVAQAPTVEEDVLTYEEYEIEDESILEHEEPMNESQIEVQEYFWADLGEYEITAYCPCNYCCGDYTDGITASGTYAKAGRTIGVDPDYIVLGATVKIVYSDGTEHEYIAEDTGSAIHGNIIDLYMDSHQNALDFGRQICHVYVKEINDPRN